MKELTPEELSIVSNVTSLLNQLTSQAGGSSAGQAGVAATDRLGNTLKMAKGDPASDKGVSHSDWVGPLFKPGSPAPSQVEGEEEEEEEGEEGEEDEEGRMAGVAPANPNNPRVVKRGKAKKAIIVGEPDASTGSSEAEDRTEDLPTYDEENLDEGIDNVAKAILRMAMGKGIFKEARPRQNPLVAALAQVAKGMQAMSGRQAMTEKVLEDMMEAIGVTKGLEDAQTHAPRKTAVQTMPQDQANVMKEFLTALVSQVAKGAGAADSTVTAEEAGLSPAERVRKSMGSIVRAMGQIAGEKWNPKQLGEE